MPGKSTTTQTMTANITVAPKIRSFVAGVNMEYLPGTLKRPSDLVNHDCIRLVVQGRQGLDQWRFKEDGRITRVQVRGGLSTSSGEVMHDWALSGRGVAQKFLWDIHDDVRAGRLIRFLEPFECDDVRLYLAYATRSYLPPRVRLFINFIVSALQESLRA